ncbi:uncharacterized protein EV420DRAFT_1578116, partial [Desarmillaria tabescens]
SSSHSSDSYKPTQTSHISEAVNWSCRIRILQSPHAMSRRKRTRHSSKGADPPGKGRGQAMCRRTTSVSMSSDGNALEPSFSRSVDEREYPQIPSEETIPHASTSASPQPMSASDETAEEILRLRTQIEQLIVERASVWNPYSETDPPPAYVEAVEEDGSGET